MKLGLYPVVADVWYPILHRNYLIRLRNAWVQNDDAPPEDIQYLVYTFQQNAIGYVGYVKCFTRSCNPIPTRPFPVGIPQTEHACCSSANIAGPSMTYYSCLRVPDNIHVAQCVAGITVQSPDVIVADGKQFN
ncbi:hypothetical protein AVEN_56563-1 [Araneus ventricosus]|uniref:Uncharacterized protein n=1 Tax=Araneus ventricosus TaxID=182803 RepID=A0A4Y2HGY1_ARAVE|nr:hypothetical protein AVEN_56563-1 [Araneus ventricosus]